MATTKMLQAQKLIEELTGQKVPFTENMKILREKLKRIFSEPLGHSQLNEILLFLGFDRISSEFFQFLVDGQLNYNKNNPSKIDSEIIFKKGIERFQKLALLRYGNVKHAFKVLSNNTNLLSEALIEIQEREDSSFTKRSEPVIPIENIPDEKTYLLGYMIQREIKKKLEKDKNDPEALQLKSEMDLWIETGKKNHHAYLTSDHLDVYVATSMRKKHEFLSISKTTKEIFTNKLIKKLNLRYFDPTQAYCKPRIDKGLSEALMLKRAKCTIYLIQETDTLGKDSELASTLAQGKPVIAYIPEVTKNYFKSYLKDLKRTYNKDLKEIIIDQIKDLAPEKILNPKIYPLGMQDIIRKKEKDLEKILFDIMVEKYDKRADTLKTDHPLGIQVHLENGVANGVLVVRSIENCAKVLYSILTRKMEFNLLRENIQDTEFLVLKEKVSGCIFRVVTSDELLTNSFWNFYI